MVPLVVSTILFYVLHSLLASESAKQWAAKVLGIQRWYRAFYNLISLLLVSRIVWDYLHLHVQMDRFLPPTPAFQLVGWGMLLSGCILAIAAVLHLGGSNFLGVTNENKTGLIRKGLHGRIRHPIYSGIILASLGWMILSCTLPTLTLVGITYIYLPIGILLEERKLVAEYGVAYLRYRNEIPSLLPRIC